MSRFFLLLTIVFSLFAMTGCNNLKEMNLKESDNETSMDLKNIDETNIESNENEDIYGGWYGLGEGMGYNAAAYLVLNTNNTFEWYIYDDYATLKDNSIMGKMEVLKGKEALSSLNLSIAQLNNDKLGINKEVKEKNVYEIKIQPTYMSTDGVDKSSQITDKDDFSMLFILTNDNEAWAMDYSSYTSFELKRIASDDIQLSDKLNSIVKQSEEKNNESSSNRSFAQYTMDIDNMMMAMLNRYAELLVEYSADDVRGEPIYKEIATGEKATKFSTMSDYCENITKDNLLNIELPKVRNIDSGWYVTKSGKIFNVTGFIYDGKTYFDARHYCNKELSADTSNQSELAKKIAYQIEFRK